MDNNYLSQNDNRNILNPTQIKENSKNDNNKRAKTQNQIQTDIFAERVFLNPNKNDDV